MITLLTPVLSSSPNEFLCRPQIKRETMWWWVRNRKVGFLTSGNEKVVGMYGPVPSISSSVDDGREGFEGPSL